MRAFLTLVLVCVVACGQSNEDECMTDEDCSEGQECVITHDHEGDDHSHGGSCEAIDTAQ